MSNEQLINSLTVFISPKMMVHVLVTLVIGIAFLLLFKKFISAFFRSLRNRSRLQSYHQRIETLETLIESIVSIGIFISLLLMILRDFGFDMSLGG